MEDQLSSTNRMKISLLKTSVSLAGFKSFSCAPHEGLQGEGRVCGKLPRGKRHGVLLTAEQEPVWVPEHVQRMELEKGPEGNSNEECLKNLRVFSLRQRRLRGNFLILPIPYKESVSRWVGQLVTGLKDTASRCARRGSGWT